MTGVYKFTSPEGKVYIGSSCNIKKRVKHYRFKDCSNNGKFYASLLKYGYDAHKFEIVELCSKDILLERERYFGDIFNAIGESGLNLMLPKGNNLKAAIDPLIKEEKSKRVTGEKNPFFGKKHTPETLAKILAVHKGSKHTAEHRRKVSLNNAQNNAKAVLDLETGIYYKSIGDAARAKNLVHSTLKSRLNGLLINTTSFIKL